jgi:hypothetical protein
MPEMGIINMSLTIITSDENLNSYTHKYTYIPGSICFHRMIAQTLKDQKWAGILMSKHGRFHNTSGTLFY